MTTPDNTTASDVGPVEWAGVDGNFELVDGSRGNPGCDGCGTNNAVARIDGTYVCSASTLLAAHTF